MGGRWLDTVFRFHVQLCFEGLQRHRHPPGRGRCTRLKYSVNGSVCPAIQWSRSAYRVAFKVQPINLPTIQGLDSSGTKKERTVTWTVASSCEKVPANVFMPFWWSARLASHNPAETIPFAISPRGSFLYATHHSMPLLPSTRSSVGQYVALGTLTTVDSWPLWKGW